MTEQRKVVVSPHARDRAVQRYGGVHTWDSIATEVTEALEAGRFAKHAPRGVFTASKNRPDSTRYVWNETATRVYMIRECRSPRAGNYGQKFWLVITALNGTEVAA